jgi:hypothetical protein
MSEYQFYEFRAIDRPLGVAEMAALRRMSTRARITWSRQPCFPGYGQI